MGRRLPLLVLGVAAVVIAVWYARSGDHVTYFTGFVEGEERVLRSDVSGRVLEVAYAEDDGVEPDAAVARLDDRDIRSRIAAQEQQIAVIAAQVEEQQRRVAVMEQTWPQDVNARRGELRRAEAAAQLAARTFTREQELVRTGVSTPQRLDQVRADRDQAASALVGARDLLQRAEAEGGSIDVARQQIEVLTQQRELAVAELRTLQVTASKYVIRAPAVATTVETQFIWPGELAQPGTPILAVLDPLDKYVQIYVPVSQVDRVRVGGRVEIELDSQPGRRLPGEVSFVADTANFTPEKIETRSDRLGQVYRAKVTILEDVERCQPGTEGNVYLTGGGEARGDGAAARK